MKGALNVTRTGGIATILLLTLASAPAEAAEHPVFGTNAGLLAVCQNQGDAQFLMCNSYLRGFVAGYLTGAACAGSVTLPAFQGAYIRFIQISPKFWTDPPAATLAAVLKRLAGC